MSRKTGIISGLSQMSENKTKKHNAEIATNTVSSEHIGHSQVRTVSPLGMRVLLRIRKNDNRSEGGLYLPEGSKQSLQESVIGEVIEVAVAVDKDTNEEANVSGIPLGASVLIPKNVGTKVPWDDSLLLVDTKDVLAIINEVAIS